MPSGFSFLFAKAAGTPSSTSPDASSSSPYYQSITALDKYGNSPQIRNAGLASSKHGALIVSALSIEDGAAVVCSLHRPRIGVRRREVEEPHVPLTSAAEGRGGHAVSVVASGCGYGDGEGSSGSGATTTLTTTAIACSGIKSDASLLVSILRSYARRVWDSYDAVPTAEAMADAASEAVLTFMGYDRTLEVTDGAGPVCEEEGGGDNRGFTMARPFGVQALVLGVESGRRRPPLLSQNNGRRRGSGYATMWSVDPSGVAESYVARAMGRGSDEANKLLAARWRRDISKEEAEDMCKDIVREVVKKEYEGDRKFDWDGSEVVCEMLSLAGLQLKRFPLHDAVGSETSV